MGESGSESDLSEYEHDLEHRGGANTAFSVSNVNAVILDRGVWNPEAPLAGHEEHSAVTGAGTKENRGDRIHENPRHAKPSDYDPDSSGILRSPVTEDWTPASLEKRKKPAEGRRARFFDDKIEAFDRTNGHGWQAAPTGFALAAKARETQQIQIHPQTGEPSVLALTTISADLLPPAQASSTRHWQRASRFERAQKACAARPRGSDEASKCVQNHVEWPTRTPEQTYLFKPATKPNRLPVQKRRREIGTGKMKGKAPLKAPYAEVLGENGDTVSRYKASDGKIRDSILGVSTKKEDLASAKRPWPEVKPMNTGICTDEDEYVGLYTRDQSEISSDVTAAGQGNCIEFATPARQVVAAARRELSQYDPPQLQQRSASLRESTSSPFSSLPVRARIRSKTNLGNYDQPLTDFQTDAGRIQTGKTGLLTREDRTEHDDLAGNFHDDDLNDRHLHSLPGSLLEHVTGGPQRSRPIFFSTESLKDPVQAFRQRERRYKRDGSLRDRLGRAHIEASIRSHLRENAFMGLETSLEGLQTKDGRARVENVQREVSRALNILEGKLPRSTLDLSHVPPVTPLIDHGLVLDRMSKGLSSVDTKLLAGREACVLPKSISPRMKIHDGAMEIDTKSLPTAQMIRTHADMLDKQAHESSSSVIKLFQDNEACRVHELRQGSWALVQRWEGRLHSLPRIRGQLREISSVEFGWKKDLEDDGATINAYLRTGADERAERVLTLPHIRDMVPYHQEAYASELRRNKIVKAMETLKEQKVVLLENSEKALVKKEEFRTELEPLKEKLREMDELLHAAGDVGFSPAQIKMHRDLAESVAKVEKRFAKCIEFEQLEKISEEIMQTVVSLDAMLNEEESIFEQVKAQETRTKTEFAAKQAREEEADLKKKLEFLVTSNPTEKGRHVCELLANIIARIVCEPENREWRNVQSMSRSSPIQLILQQKGGRDVLTAVGFYQSTSVWSVPSDWPLHKLQIGCEHLCVLLGVPDKIVLRRVQLQGSVGGSIASDLLKKMMTGEDAENAETAIARHKNEMDALKKLMESDHNVDHAQKLLDNIIESAKADGHIDEKEQAEIDAALAALQAMRKRRAKAVIKAAEADGHIDEEEQKNIDEALAELGEDAQESLEHDGYASGSDRGLLDEQAYINGCGDEDDEDQLAVDEESAEEKALTQLFHKLDTDGGGSLSIDEIHLALAEFNIDEDRAGVSSLLEEVASQGEMGMGLEAFKTSMIRIINEPDVEEDPFDGMDPEQVTRLKSMLQRMVNGTMFTSWDKWKVYVGIQQISRSGALENYKRFCQYLTIAPSIGTLFQRFLQSRADDEINLAGRGMSSLAFKAFATGMCGWQPDFLRIQQMGKIPKEYITSHPEVSFEVRCDPHVNVFELRKTGSYNPLTKLNLSDNSGGPDCALDVKFILMNSVGCLTHFNLSSNCIGEDGGLVIAEALSADLSLPLVRLELAHNRMGDKATSAIITALSETPLIRTLTYLDISGNECGHETSVEMGKYFADEVCQLQHLDLGWNSIRGMSSGDIFRGLAVNVTLTYLNLSWNGIEVRSCAALGEMLKTCVLTTIDLNHCNITGDGALLIANGLKKNTVLRTLILDCNNLKQSGARALVKASIASEAHTDAHGHERLISMIDCNLQSVDSSTFNKAEPAGKYVLDFSDPYDANTFKELLSIAIEGKGCFASVPQPRIDYYGDESWKQYIINLPTDPNEDTWVIPNSGILEFSFASLASSENAQSMSASEIEWLHTELKSPGKTERDRIGAIRSFCEGDNFLTFDQVKEMLDMLPEDMRSLERCELVQQCFSRLTEPERGVEILQHLTINERKDVEKKLGMVAIAFTHNNATGFYKLDLSKKPQRNVCLRLCEINNSQQTLLRRMDAYYATRKGGARQPVERTWRNAKLDDAPHTWSSTWAVPMKGYLELDFVQLLKPMSDEKLTTDEEFLALLLKLKPLTEEDQILSVRNWLNKHVILCEQAEELLTMMKKQKARVEILVIVYARLLDWHGYTSLLSMISIAEMNMLVKRLGFVNLFDEVMAVGYYELDLALVEHRLVAQELVHLAMVEPGENMVDCQYNGVDFPLPVGWGVDVPKKGHFSFYYCREQPVIERVLQYGSYDSQDYPYAIEGELPRLHRSRYGVWYLKDFLLHDMPQPAGIEWVRHARMRRIKMKMLKSAQSAKEMFDLLDTDGGGELDRKEISVGLFRLGIWLQPVELAAFLDALDEDGGGEVDMAEFAAWWESTQLMPPRRLLSAASRWLQKAGVKTMSKKLNMKRHISQATNCEALQEAVQEREKDGKSNVAGNPETTP